MPLYTAVVVVVTDKVTFWVYSVCPCIRSTVRLHLCLLLLGTALIVNLKITTKKTNLPSDKISKKGVGEDRHRLVFICGMGNQFASIMINGVSAICATSMERFTIFEVTFPWMIFRDSTEEKRRSVICKFLTYCR